MKFVASFLIIAALTSTLTETAQAQTSKRRARPTKQAPAPQPPSPPPSEPTRERNYRPSAPESHVRLLPEAVYAPAAGVNAFTVTPAYTYAKSDFSVAGTSIGEFKISSTTFDFEYLHGLTEVFSLGLRTSYGFSQSDLVSNSAILPSSTSKSSGIGDIYLTSDAVMPLGQLVLKGQLDLGISPGNSKSSSSTSDGNRASGGFSLIPGVTLGYEVASKNWIGLNLSYTLQMERTTDNTNGTSTKSSGGNSLSPSVFYEYRSEEFYISPVAATTMTEEGTSTTGTSTFKSSPRTQATYALRGGYYFTPATVLGFQYFLAPIKGEGSSASYNVHYIGLTARFEF